MVGEAVTDPKVSDAAVQLKWLAEAATRTPVSEKEIREHLAQPLLTAVGGFETINAVLAQYGQLDVGRIRAARPGRVQASVRGNGTEYFVRVCVDAAGLIDDIQMTPVDSVTSWAEIDPLLAELGTRVSFAAAEIGANGQCDIVHDVDASTLRPVGSTFKLYVLAALGQAVADKRADWHEQLEIREDWKSLPSGTLQDRPAGSKLSLAEFADHMTAISDNTATDHLIHRVGRDAVHQQLALLGHHRPEVNIPLLTTRAFFQLKGTPGASRAEQYLTVPTQARAAAIAELERLPLPELGADTWTRPSHIDEIEYFASPTDVCRAFAGLQRLAQPEIDHALSLNDDGLNLDSSQFPTVWYKPGDEPGVVTQHYLARDTGDRTFVVSLMVSDPTTAPDKWMTLAKGQKIIRAAFHLLARH